MIFTEDPAELEGAVDCETCGRPTTREVVIGAVPGMFAWICRHPGCTHTRGEDGQPGRGGRGGRVLMQRVVVFEGKLP